MSVLTDNFQIIYGMLLKASLDDGGKPLSDGEIASLLLSMINVGTDTIAMTAEWVMAEVMAHPDIRKSAG